jgi:hypothetical protein
VQAVFWDGFTGSHVFLGSIQQGLRPFVGCCTNPQKDNDNMFAATLALVGLVA